MKHGKTAILEFRSEAEEQEFWSTHDSTDFVDWNKADKALCPNLKPTMKIEVLLWFIGELLSKLNRAFVSVEFHKVMVSDINEKTISKSGFTCTIWASDDLHPFYHKNVRLAYI